MNQNSNREEHWRGEFIKGFNRIQVVEMESQKKDDGAFTTGATCSKKD